jgi:hypothetical protein
VPELFRGREKKVEKKKFLIRLKVMGRYVVFITMGIIFVSLVYALMHLILERPL